MFGAFLTPNDLCLTWNDFSAGIIRIGSFWPRMTFLRPQMTSKCTSIESGSNLLSIDMHILCIPSPGIKLVIFDRFMTLNHRFLTVNDLFWPWMTSIYTSIEPKSNFISIDMHMLCIPSPGIKLVIFDRFMTLTPAKYLCQFFDNFPLFSLYTRNVFTISTQFPVGKKPYFAGVKNQNHFRYFNSAQK